MFKLFPKKTSHAVKHARLYSYYPMPSWQGVELRRNIRELLASK